VGGDVLKAKGLFMILDLHRQGLSVSSIARRLDLDRKTVRKYIACGTEAPAYGPRAPRPQKIDPYVEFVRSRLQAYPQLSAVRLLREIQPLGFTGGYGLVKETVRELRPQPVRGFEHRFETAAGEQAQVDFAQFRTAFALDPEQVVTLWLFTMVLGYSRYLWGEFVWHQDLLTVLRSHVRAFAALGGIPREILYDRMKTAVLGEVSEGIIYNERLQAIARHYDFTPRACAAYRAKTKGKVERPYRYIRQDFFLGRAFQDLQDLNAQFREWLDTVANRRRHGTTHRPIAQAFVSEQEALRTLPTLPFNTIVALERGISRDGMVQYNDNAYSVPDGVRSRAVEIQVSLNEIQIFTDAKLVAVHTLREGRHERSLASGHRRWPPPGLNRGGRHNESLVLKLPGEQVARRPLQVYERIGTALAAGSRR
jgi:transposase